MKRRFSSSSLQLQSQFLTSTMSSRPRPTYRGVRHQYKRGFADRTSSGSDQFITGDSTPIDANRVAFNTRPPRPFNYRLSYPPPPPPPFNQSQSFHPPPFSNPPRPQFNAPPPSFKNRPPQSNYPPPPFNQNQSLRPQAFNQNQQVRRRPQKPLDYRNWEYARTRPPPDCERFTVLSYNILADYLAIDHRSKLYYHIPRHMLDWEWRKKNIFFELGLWSADILCFQEVDRFQDLEEELKVRGYCGVWKMRTGNPVDGCATFWRFSRFKLLHEESIEFNKLGLRDNVAQICVLESVDQKDKRYKSAIPTSSAGSSKVVICNIHVLYNPRRGEIKLGQVRNLLNRAYAVSKLWDDVPVVLCGDFNCTPKSPLYNFISEQKLDLSELPRDKLSGQASAEIRAPRPFPNLRTQSVDTPTMVDNMKDVAKSEPPKVDSHQEDVLHSSVISTGHGEDLDVTSNATHGSSSENRKSNLHDESETLNCEKVICDDSSTVAKTLHELGSTLNMDLPTSTSIDIILDEKIENVSSNKIVEPTEAETLDEDDTSFSSDLHNIDVANPGGQQLHPPSDGVLDYNNPDLDFNPVDVERPTYDPSAWTPMEIETATGSSDCILMEHPLKLTSTYSEAEDSSGTRDSNGEPLVTSYNRCFLGTVDYIWHSEGLQTVKVLAPIPKHAMQWTPGFPTKKWGSDHIALVSEVAFAKDMTNQDEAR